jgi:hypothetical protein
VSFDALESTHVYSVRNDDGSGHAGVRLEEGPVVLATGDEKIATGGGSKLDPTNG